MQPTKLRRHRIQNNKTNQACITTHKNIFQKEKSRYHFELQSQGGQSSLFHWISSSRVVPTRIWYCICVTRVSISYNMSMILFWISWREEKASRISFWLRIIQISHNIDYVLMLMLVLKMERILNSSKFLINESEGRWLFHLVKTKLTTWSLNILQYHPFIINLESLTSSIIHPHSYPYPTSRVAPLPMHWICSLPNTKTTSTTTDCLDVKETTWDAINHLLHPQANKHTQC